MSFESKTPKSYLSRFLFSLLVSMIFLPSLIAQAPRPVEIAPATRQEKIIPIDLTGSVVAQKNAQLSSRISGLVSQMHVEAGDHVEKGQVLMELDSEQAHFALEKTKADHAVIFAELAEAQRLVQEVQNLVKSGGFSLSEVKQREAQVTIQQARLQRVEVQIRELEDQIARHQLIAPFSGQIHRRNSEVGEWVQTGDPIFELVDDSNPWFEVRAPQEIYSALNLVNHLELWLDDQPNIEFSGKIDTQIPVIDPKTRTFLLRILFDPPDSQENKTRIGVSGRVRFVIKDPKSTLQVLKDGILRHADGSTSLWVVTEKDGKSMVQAKIVKIGQTFHHHVEVLSGIEEGERVIIRGNENLRDGMEVIVQSSKSESEKASKP